MRPSSMRSSTRSTTRAAHGLELVLGEPHDAELAIGAQALLDHLAVAVLEDVQGHALGGQRHHSQGEQRELSVQPIGHV